MNKEARRAESSSTRDDGTMYKAGLHKTQNWALNMIFQPRTIIFVLLSMLFGLAAKGEATLFMVVLWKNWDKLHFFTSSSTAAESEGNLTAANASASDGLLDNQGLGGGASSPFQDLPYYILSSMIVSNTIFLTVGGFLHW